ncbi:MAG: AMP-binding protein [Azonexus sp.]|jgi:2-aminobenzoate-CoA ligase|nr:AMP-binding protein [Azonexus sp.]
MKGSAHVDQFVIDNMPPREQWPEFIFETPNLQFPERLNACTLLVDQAVAEGRGDHPALIGERERWTYAQLQTQVNRLARLLTEDMGLVPGNRVLLRGANSPWLGAAWLAVWKAGGVAVGTMPMLRVKELKQIVTLGQISHALCEASLADELELTRAECPQLRQVAFYDSAAWTARLAGKSDQFQAVDTAADDPALIAYTSGTTGVPKGCIHGHRDIIAMCEEFPRHCLKPDRTDVFIGTPPLAFTFGLGGFLCFPLYYRASTVLLEKLPPAALLAAMEKYRTTICFTSPTAYRQMTPLAKNHDLRALKKSVSAGEPLPTPTRDAWRAATGIQIHDGVGGTEIIHIYIASDPDNYRPGAIGKPLPGYRAKLVDKDLNPVPVGEEGWLALKGPTGCRYLADTRQTYYVRNGWNITGDTYHVDADGYYYFHARVDDIIVTSGYNVAGPEVESVLLEHPAVAECAVVGVPDAERGQILKAFVVLNSGHADGEARVKELQEFVKNNAAPYKYPRQIEFMERLPRTETGKLQRFRLKQPA